MTIQELMATRPPPQRVEEVARAAAEAVRRRLGGDVRVIWYGSWVHGKACARSDIDLAILSPDPVLPEALDEAARVLEELPTLYMVNILDLAGVSRSFQDEVLRTGIDI